jgi:hypothetical protein
MYLNCIEMGPHCIPPPGGHAQGDTPAFAPTAQEPALGRERERASAVRCRWLLGYRGGWGHPGGVCLTTCDHGHSGLSQSVRLRRSMHHDGASHLSIAIGGYKTFPARAGFLAFRPRLLAP